MKLSQLCRDVGIDAVIAGPAAPVRLASSAGTTELGEGTELGELEIGEVHDDSRAVAAGDLFVALTGQAVDGHRFVAQAAARGAAVAIVEHPVDLPPEASALIQLQVKSTAQALAILAANRYGRPADGLTLVGITGTNGKTTTNFLVEALLAEAGLVPGLIGTITYRYRGRSFPAPFTTPTPLLLHRTLAEMSEQGVRAVTLETSSHALALGRLHGLQFRIAAFTNLSQDHLDFHQTMDQYYEAKTILFRNYLLPPELGGIAVVNIDDSYGRRLAAELPAAQRLTVSIEGPADIMVASERIAIEGIAATLRTPVGEVMFQSGLTGRFNLANLALATGIGVALGLPAAFIGRGLSRVSGVAGRLERVASPRGGRGPTVFVDYAHTPDALERTLAAIRPLTTGAVTATSPTGRRGRLIVVFGCGGDRDAGKRPQMGQVAAREADVVVITSDNPRTENPQTIIDAIVAGVQIPEVILRSGQPGTLPRIERAALATAVQGFHVEPDRKQAINAAILSARAEDVVLLAGKGHEDYQVVGTAKHRFDDREEAQRALLQREAVPPRSGSGPHISPAAPVAETIELPVARILAATEGKLRRSGPQKFSSVTIDSRTVTAGCLFVAVRGERHDGHSFITQAIAAGAAGLLVERDRQEILDDTTGLTVIEVPDTVVALGQLARAHREAPEIASRLRLVAVTGSSGKTTTKDLIAAILAAHASDPKEVLKTDGNLNNHLGVPLTLLRLRPGQRYAVVEMGMSARGEIAYLTALARPDIGVITNIGPAHLETLGTLANVALAKGELFTGMLDGAAAVYLVAPPNDETRDSRSESLAAVHQQAVRAGVTSGRLRGFGAQAVRGPGEVVAGAAVKVELLQEGADGLQLDLHFPMLASPAGPLTIRLPLLGAHQADNAALAAATALALDIPPATIATGLAQVTRGKHRGQTLVIAGRHVLDDCYNANPDSMAAALRTLNGLRGEHAAVAILGDMLELGPGEAALHAQIGEVAATCQLARLITVGSRARHIATAAERLGVPTELADTAAAAAAAAAAATQPGDWILLKGSRGMALEGVLDRLREILQDPATPAAAPQVH